MQPIPVREQPDVPRNIAPSKSPSPWMIARRKFLRNRLAMAGLAFLIVTAALSFLAPYVTTEDPTKLNIRQINQAPSAEHWLGTDKGGRDVYTRLLYGGRVSLTIGLSISLLVILAGTVIGATAGYFGGKTDNLLMRFTDFILNFPLLLFVIVFSAIFQGSGVLTLILVISALSWGSTARLVRSKVLAEKENEYILSAVSIGCTPLQVIVKHLLPNVVSTIIVQFVYLVATMIAVETALSFLGFGVQANVPSWGNMMSDAISPEVIRNQWWVWAPAGTLITLTILAINFVGEGLKDAFNPKSQR
ncbi:ABC transporter permease [Brevibacillus humidisoli]|nr:oligopeptide ABC transporter permease [Brevibacillus humidisoli]UFJ40173.1 ABC transporter permease [Brevibacillus humidisoli]